MKRFYAVLITLICLSSAIFADTSFVGRGNPTAKGDNTNIDVAFTYDPETMQRLSFGFTDRDEISWNDNSDDYGKKVLNLKTRYVRDKITYGYGNINFYWKLKTTNSIDAKLYLEGPLKDPQTGVTLDWSLSFIPKQNDQRGIELSVVDEYGKSAGKTIYTKNAKTEQDVQVGLVNIAIRTADSDASVIDEDQNYEGVIGVSVDIV